MTSSQPQTVPSPAGATVSVSYDPRQGWWQLQLRPPGPAGANTLVLVYGVLRTDRAQPTVPLDLGVLVDADGSVSPDALEVAGLAFGYEAAAALAEGREGEVAFDPDLSPGRRQLLALAALVGARPRLPAISDAEIALRATLLSRDSDPTSALGVLAAEAAAAARKAFGVLPTGLAGLPPGEAHEALTRLAAVVRRTAEEEEPSELEAALAPVDTLPQVTDERWADITARLSVAVPVVAGTGGAFRRHSPGTGTFVTETELDLTGMALPRAVLGGSPATVVHDRENATFVLECPLVAELAARVWLRSFDPEVGVVDLQVECWVEERRLRAEIPAVGDLGPWVEFELTTDGLSEPETRARRARRVARDIGDDARRLLDEFDRPGTFQPAEGPQGRWRDVARAWAMCGEAYRASGSEPRAALAYRMALLATEAAGLDPGPVTKVLDPLDPGWAGPWVDALRDLDREPAAPLTSSLEPMLAEWARAELDKLEHESVPAGQTVEAADRIAAVESAGGSTVREAAARTRLALARHAASEAKSDEEALTLLAMAVVALPVDDELARRATNLRRELEDGGAVPRRA